MAKKKQYKHDCYVCGGTIHGTTVYVGANTYRHKRCKTGTVRWLNSEVGRISKYFGLFLQDGEKRT
jgi:hypothetical protein